jgi:hypothetical protein
VSLSEAELELEESPVRIVGYPRLRARKRRFSARVMVEGSGSSPPQRSLIWASVRRDLVARGLVDVLRAVLGTASERDMVAE